MGWFWFGWVVGWVRSDLLLVLAAGQAARGGRSAACWGISPAKVAGWPAAVGQKGAGRTGTRLCRSGPTRLACRNGLPHMPSCLLPFSALAAGRDNRGDSEGDRAFDVLTRELVFEAKAKPGERTLAGGWRARWELCAGQVEGSCDIRHVLSVRMHPDSSQVIIPSVARLPICSRRAC